VLNIRHSQALGTTDGGTVIASGRELQLQGGIAVGSEPLTLSGAGVASSGALRNISSDNSYAGPITLASVSRINSDANLLTLNVASGNAISAVNQNLAIGGAGSVTIADPVVLGSGSLVKDGVGVLTLSGASSYSGGTIVSNGTLRITTASALPGTGLLKLCTGTTLDIAGGTPISAPAAIASFDSTGGNLRLSTADRLSISGSMTGSLVVAISDPQNLNSNQVYVVATYGGTPPTSVTLTGVSSGWLILAVNGEIRMVFSRGTMFSVF
jgi:autotransporter-associated beta strand protein